MVTSFGCTPAAVLAFTARAFASDAKAEPTCRRARVVDVSGDIAEELSDMLIAYGAQSTM